MTLLPLSSIPDSAKLFSVWSIEKEKGSGSIITSTGKLNIRPISLFETYYKLIERIIQSRLQAALSAGNVLDTNQFGFTPGKGVDDLLLIFNFLMEDSKQFSKEI